MTVVGLVRIDIEGRDAYVRTPVWARDLMRALPDRHWSPVRNAWVVPASHTDAVALLLRTEGYLVRIIDQARGIRPPLQLPPARRPVPD